MFFGCVSVRVSQGSASMLACFFTKLKSFDLAVMAGYWVSGRADY